MPKKVHNKITAEDGFMYRGGNRDEREVVRTQLKRGCLVRLFEDRVSWFRLSRHNPFPTLKPEDEFITID